MTKPAAPAALSELERCLLRAELAFGVRAPLVELLRAEIARGAERELAGEALAFTRALSHFLDETLAWQARSAAARRTGPPA